MAKRIDKLTPAQTEAMAGWADRWIEIGLRTGPADRAKFEAAAERCYGYAGIPWHGRVVWVSSPMVMALAGPIASFVLEARKRGIDLRSSDAAVNDAVRGAVGVAVRDAVDDAVRGAVGGMVRGAVRVAVDDTVSGAVDDTVRVAVDAAVDAAVNVGVSDEVSAAVDDAVRGAVRVAVRDAVDDAVRGAVGGMVRVAVRVAVDDTVSGAVDDTVRDAVDAAVNVGVSDAVSVAVDDAVRGAVRGMVDGAVDDTVRDGVLNVIQRSWSNYIGGQFWVGGYYWGGAFTSFFRDVCSLELPQDLWERARAYEDTIQSACWWWPHRDFIVVCERPTAINREARNPSQTRGWGSHQLHAERGPAVVWPDGWSIYSHHGVRMPADIYENPSALTGQRIDSERNAEVRRVMISLFGSARYAREGNFTVVDKCGPDHPIMGLRNAILLRRDMAEDEPMVMLDMQDSTPDPKTGEHKRYLLRVDPNAYGGQAGRECHAAMASTWRVKSDTTQLAFRLPEDYRPEIET